MCHISGITYYLDEKVITTSLNYLYRSHYDPLSTKLITLNICAVI